MNFIECVRMTFSSIKVNKMRSFLTMLGIIIEISSVITITTIGSSIQKTLSNTFKELGTNSMSVWVEQRDYEVESLPILTKDDELTRDMLNDLLDQYPEQFQIVEKFLF